MNNSVPHIYLYTGNSWNGIYVYNGSYYSGGSINPEWGFSCGITNSSYKGAILRVFSKIYSVGKIAGAPKNMWEIKIE
jgi:hypothetical protein